MDDHAAEHHLRGQADPARRAFLLGSAAVLLGGCASTRPERPPLPAPPWSAGRDPDAGTGSDGTPATELGPVFAGVTPRTVWAGGAYVPSLMNRMRPVRAITVHHDAIVFSGKSEGDMRARLESIRRGHRERGWGDIGYHYAIDRSGRVWEGRPLVFQGAHVKDQNEGNIGVMCVGNFELQSPSNAQVAALQRHVSMLQKRYRVPSKRVYTHREWSTARTLCPGRNLQQQVVVLRRQRAFG